VKTFSQKIIAYNKNLQFSASLPDGYKVLNPFSEHEETIDVMEAFYQKYYNDFSKRKFIIGINPSRNGAGVTGVPFTDTKRLEQVCGIKMESAYTHEVSSVYLYDMIAEYGGVDIFYKEFYINSPFPLAIVRQTKNGSWVNANYYDSKALFESVKDFMIHTLKSHISLGLETSEVYVLGKKGATFIQRLNEEEKMFGDIVALDHPRYIQQYRSKEKQLFIDQYIITLKGYKLK